MRVLERLRVLTVWFRGEWDPQPASDCEFCEWCNAALDADGTCEPCSDVDARSLVFFDE